MKRLFLLFNLILSFGLLSAQETYRFSSEAAQGFRIESSSSTGLLLHYSVPGIGISAIDDGEAKGQEIIMKGSFGSYAEGLPNLPFENRYIAVPKGATVSIKVKEKGCRTLTGIDILPAAAVQGNAAVGKPRLQKDMSVYGKDANYPNENVAIAQTTQIRGLDVVMLNVTPFRYNPVRKTLEVIYDMDIEVRFEGGSGQFGEARYRNPAWDGILRDLVINSDMLPEAHYYDLLNEAIRSGEEGCEYLIVSPDDEDILAWADSLRHFRTKQGILTKVVSTTECGGNDPEHIKGYIQNAYDNWAIPPAALMIFNGYHDTIIGDQTYPLEGISGFPLFFKNYESGYGYSYDEEYMSDNLYADMNGDSIPDMSISRLSALKPSEYQTQLGKLFEYETNPPTDPHYYDHPVITSSHEYNKWFMITSQAVNGFFCNKLGRHPSNFYMLYEYSTQTVDSAWSTGYNTSAPVDYFGPDGQGYFPRYLNELNEWRHMNENQYFIDAMSEGSFLTLYRDHSSSDRWCSPYFYSQEIPNLHNENPTFLLSIGCNTAKYEQYHTGYYGKDLITAFCNDPVGALGGIGAVTVTRSHFNDILTWGIFDYFWPDFMPTLGSTTAPLFARPSFALVVGKLFLNQHAFMPGWWPGSITDTHNVFHYLGETYLNLHTEVPQQMTINAEPYTNSQSDYTLTAEEGAVICLTRGDEILIVTQATGQPQHIALPHLPIGERLTLTVTKQNRIRFEKAVTVISNALPFVYVKNADIKDQDGNGQLDYGEYADIDITLNNHSEIGSESGEITLLCDSPYVEIVQGLSHYPQMAANANLTIGNAFRIRLSSSVPDQAKIQLKVRFNENENTHVDDIDITANAPIIIINPEFRPMTAEDEPSTHISTEGSSSVTFTVKNAGHSRISLIQGNLDVKAPFVSVQNVPQQENLMPDEEWPATFEFNTTPNDVTGAWLQSHLDIQYGERHAYYDTVIQYGGIFENFETDTLNPFFRWENSLAKWAYDSEDAYEGQRCFKALADTATSSMIRARLTSQLVNHDSKVSFRFKTGNGETLSFGCNQGETHSLSADDWQYAEALYFGKNARFTWSFVKQSEDSPQAKIDDICFPPKHTPIASAGNDIIVCEATTIVLSEAYAYDCDSVRWTTDGDGHFEDGALANTMYIPGNGDVSNGQVMLTLTAYGSTTFAHSAMIRFTDGITLGNIVGDSIVNKYENHVSHYSVEEQDGVHYLWQLTPAEAGVIYDRGSEIDILWNLSDGDAEVTLTVTADDACDMEPATKSISLIGYSTSEWHIASFDLFPNPTDGKVNLVVGETVQGKAVVEVYNLLGERMMVKSLGNVQQSETISLDLSHLVSGLYIVKLSTENGSCSKKVSVR